MIEITTMTEDEQMELMFEDQKLFKSLLETTADLLQATQGLQGRADIIRLAIRYIECANDIQADIIAESSALYDENKDLKRALELVQKDYAVLSSKNKDLEATVAAHRSDVDSVYTENRKLRKRLEEYGNWAADWRAMVISQAARPVSESSEITKLHEENTKLKKRLADALRMVNSAKFALETNSNT